MIAQNNHLLMLFKKVKVGNLTFDGIDSLLLHIGPEMGDIGDAINASIPYDRFGWFYSVSEVVTLTMMIKKICTCRFLEKRVKRL